MSTVGIDPMAAALAELPFTRLIHFTPAKNLPHILRDGLLRSSQDLARNASWVFAPTDQERFDAHPDHLCCSIEYPNAYYRERARTRAEYRNFRDWVHLVLDRNLVATPGALFSGGNAAKGGGAHLSMGAGALRSLWSNPSRPGGYPRRATHLPASPTDLQAEVLVPGPVPISAVLAVITESPEVAHKQFRLLQRIGLPAEALQWGVAPALYHPSALTGYVHRGERPREEPWMPNLQDYP